MVSINSNKYSFPVKYVNKTVKYRIIYGFRIEIYDQYEVLIQTYEACQTKHKVFGAPKHYEAIAQRTSTSIPQIRRDFTVTFKHGALYLENAGRSFEEPTHHARRILELIALCDADILERFVLYEIEHDQMDIKSFKKLLKERYSEIVGVLSNETNQLQDSAEKECLRYSEEIGLARDCSYYERIGKEECMKQ